MFTYVLRIARWPAGSHDRAALAPTAHWAQCSVRVRYATSKRTTAYISYVDT